MDQAKLLDEVLRKTHLHTDYALAKAWGIGTNTMSQYRTGIRHFDTYALARVSEALDKDPRELMAIQALEKKPTGERRSWWETLLKKRFTAWSGGASIAVCIGTFATHAPSADATTRPQLNIDQPTNYTTHPKRKRWTAWRAARATIRRLVTSTPPLALTAPSGA
jgi:hypothetical protein